MTVFNSPDKVENHKIGTKFCIRILIIFSRYNTFNFPKVALLENFTLHIILRVIVFLGFASLTFFAVKFILLFYIKILVSQKNYN